MILADDLGYGDVGFQGSPDIPTPNIDALALNGVVCTNGYVTHPVCSPSRAAIMTGRYQQRFGHELSPTFDTLIPMNPDLGLPLSEITLPQLLKPAGYVSGIIGKWHLGFAPDLFPTERGFDEFFGFLDAEQGYYGTTIWEYGTLVNEPVYLTDAFTREGVSFINRHAAQPFFLYLAYNAVHKPYDVPPDVYMERVSYITDPQRRIYAAMACALDDGVGQIVATLQANNLLENTLIFFLSDNGAADKSFTRSSNLPLRGYKGDMLDGGIRVPFIVQWVGQLPGNVVYGDLISSLDIVATATAAAGVTLPTDRIYDGLNIIPYLSGQQVSPPRTLCWRWFGLGPDGPPGASNSIWAVRNGPLKLVVERDEDDEPPALYNLADDIGETQNLAGTQLTDVAALTQLYRQWNATTIPPIWQDNTDLGLLPLVLAGDWNGFSKDDANSPWRLTAVKAPDAQGTPDAYNWYTTTIHAATTGGDTTPGVHSFSLIGTQSYREQWCGVSINIDNKTDVPFFSGTTLGPTNSITFDDGFYYSMRIVDSNIFPTAGTSLQMAVMKTSSPPVTLSRASQTPAMPTASDPIVVSISLSQRRSPEERIFLRWTTDGFITSHIIKATGAGSIYSATIPPQPAGSWLLYTLVSSTTDLTPYSTSGVIDSLILATTSVFSAMLAPSPTPTPSPTATPPGFPQITRQPSDITVAAGRRASFRVAASGTTPLSYQWSKNGVAITGATASKYTTAPATTADNGSLFSVLVTNSVGSVRSRDAVLTVR